MPIRRYKPTSPGRRFMSVSTFEEITKGKPEKSLLEPVTKKGGRNNNGRITTRHQGGGHKRRYRVIDFKRTKDGHPARRQGFGLRRAALALRRDAPRRARVPRDGRAGRQRRPPEHHGRQGGPEPLAGQAPRRARLRDEPRRPPTRRRRGQVEGRP